MFDSIARRIERHDEEIRRLKLRPTGTAAGAPLIESHTFVIGGFWDTSLYIPPLLVFCGGPGAGNWGTPETKTIVTASYYTRTGSVTGVTFAVGHPVLDPAPISIPSSGIDLPEWVNYIRPVVSGSGEDLSIGIGIKVLPG